MYVDKNQGWFAWQKILNTAENEIRKHLNNAKQLSAVEKRELESYAELSSLRDNYPMTMEDKLQVAFEEAKGKKMSLQDYLNSSHGKNHFPEVCEAVSEGTLSL